MVGHATDMCKIYTNAFFSYFFMTSKLTMASHLLTFYILVLVCLNMLYHMWFIIVHICDVDMMAITYQQIEYDL